MRPLISASAGSVWVNGNVLSNSEIEELRGNGIDLTIFSSPIDPSDRAAIEEAISTSKSIIHTGGCGSNCSLPSHYKGFRQTSEFLSNSPFLGQSALLIGYNTGMNQRPSILERFTDRAVMIARLANALSAHRGHADIEPQDFLDALANDECVASEALKYSGIPRVERPNDLVSVDDGRLESSGLARQIMIQARIEGEQLGHRYPGTEHQLLALMRLHPELVGDAKQIRLEVLAILGHA